MKRLCMLLLICTCLYGCASPYKGTWYLVNDEERKNSKMYLSILNTSPEIRTIKKIMVNGIKGEPSSGFTLECPDCRLGPGEMLTRDLALFAPVKQWRCRVPISIFVQTEQDCWQAVKSNVGMPSFLPQDWDDCH